MKNSSLVAKIYAPDIDPRVRHPQIFSAFDRLNSGEFLELTNDHDPKPLYYQFMFERGDSFTWEYITEGPSEWKVLIGKK